MDASLQELSLATVGGGAALEVFDEELRKVLENIGDPNTDAEDVREVVLKVRIKPSKDRSFGAVGIRCTSKLAATRPYATQVLFSTDGTTVRAWESRAKQGDLGLEKVTTFRKEGDA